MEKETQSTEVFPLPETEFMSVTGAYRSEKVNVMDCGEKLTLYIVLDCVHCIGLWYIVVDCGTL